MTTPAFNPIRTLLGNVRFYTQFDPYYYTIDNRPLTDISNNVEVLTTGIDGARLASLMSSFNSKIESVCQNGVANNFFQGLTPSKVDASHVKIGVGEVLIPLSVNSSISQVVLKKAILQSEVTLQLTSLPTTAGTSKVFVVEGKYSDVNADSPTSTYFFDAGNSSLFDTCLDGLLSVQINANATAFTTGAAEVLPTTSPGWIPLYCITVRQSEEWDKIYAHPNSPAVLKGQGLNKELYLRLPTSAAASSVTTLDPFPAFQFSESADSSVVASINLKTEEVNRFKDIAITLNYTSATTGGNFAIIASYAVVNALGIVTPISFTTNVVEALAGPSLAYSLSNSVLLGKVPGNVLQGAEQLLIKITRVGTNGTVDTSTGNLLLLGASVTQ